MKLIVDRIEGEIAVCEDENGEMIEVKLTDFADEPKDGNIVWLNNDGKYEIRKEETEEKSKDIEERFSKLFFKGE